MKRKVLLVVALMLALSVTMAAMAYNSATVTNASELKIVNTNEALITLEDNTPWSWQDKTGALDKTAVMKDGELFFQFGKGVDRDGTTPKFYGLQPNSEYQWNPLFTLRNKSAEKVQITISATGPFAQYITFGTMGQGQSPVWGTQGQPLVINNVPKETGSGMQNIRNIAVKINIPHGASVSQSALIGSIIVQSDAVK